MLLYMLCVVCVCRWAVGAVETQCCACVLWTWLWARWARRQQRTWASESTLSRSPAGVNNIQPVITCAVDWMYSQNAKPKYKTPSPPRAPVLIQGSDGPPREHIMNMAAYTQGISSDSRFTRRAGPPRTALTRRRRPPKGSRPTGSARPSLGLPARFPPGLGGKEGGREGGEDKRPPIPTAGAGGGLKVTKYRTCNYLCFSLTMHLHRY